MNEYCIFCDIDSIKGDIVYDFENFFVKVGVGILSPGHVMLISKIHIPCFALLPEKFHDEFRGIKNFVEKKISSEFSNPLVYEQGIHGQSINHAHLHFLPSRNKLYDLSRIFSAGFVGMMSKKLGDFFEVSRVYHKDGSYFYLEFAGEKHAFETKGLQTGERTFRKEFAKITGLYGLEDWRNMSQEEKQNNFKWVQETKSLLRNNLKH